MMDPCGCAERGTAFTPSPIANRPGLPALAYRIGTYATFFAAMKARLSGSDMSALLGLKTREANDPAIALCDAWAVLADILTFYQERIANEGYLRTATERRSVVELARLVGSSLRRGVSASTYLAYSLEQNSTATIPRGSRAQSMPAQGQLPQTFETADDVAARGVWNNFAPRLTRPQLVNLAPAPPKDPTIYLAGITTNLKPNDPLLVTASSPTFGRIATVTVDSKLNRTTITLQPRTPLERFVKDEVEREQLDAERTTPADDSFTSVVSLTNALVNPSSTANGELPPRGQPVDTSDAALQRDQQADAFDALPERDPQEEASLRRARQQQDALARVSDTTPRVLKTFYPAAGSQLYTAWKNVSLAPAVSSEVHALRIEAAPFGHNAPLRPITDRRGVVTGTEEWPLDIVTLSIAVSAQSESDAAAGEISLAHIRALMRGEPLKAFVKFTRGPKSSSAEITLSDTMSSTDLGSWTMEARAHRGTIDFHCPELDRRFEILVEERPAVAIVKIDQEAPIRVAEGRTASSSAAGRRTAISHVDGISITDESAVAPEDSKVIELDAVYDHIVPDSWVAINRPEWKEPRITQVSKVQKVSVVRYGLSARVTQLTLLHGWLDKNDRLLSAVRNVTVAAQSEKLVLAEEPIEDEVAGDEIELGDLYSDVPASRWLIVSGERNDVRDASGKPTSGVIGTELVMLAGIEHRMEERHTPYATDARPGERVHSFLKLAGKLAYHYKRDTVTVFGNVVRATHGETRNEVLGSGDGSLAMQSFTLHQSPLTHLSAPTRAGATSTLEVRVNDILWHEVPTLADAGASDRCYITRADDAGKTTITFGDGTHGMRVPTGRENVKATYRTGIGSVGNLPANAISQLGSKPFGVKAVIGPLAATGGADPDDRDQGKALAPIAVSALDRLVSVDDHAAFARTFAGIGKASAVRLSTGVYLTIAGVDAAPLDGNSELVRNLVEAFRQFGDPQLPVEVGICELMLLVISAKVSVLPDYQWDAVEPQIRSALTDAFSFRRRDLGQSVALSEVISTIQLIPGVDYVDVDGLDAIARSDLAEPGKLSAKLNSTRPRKRVGACPAGMDARTKAPRPAQLAFLSPDIPATVQLRR